MTAPTLKLSDLAGPDADGWSDVAVFVGPDGSESNPFVVIEVDNKPYGKFWTVEGPKLERFGGYYLGSPVRRLGRGRLVPARIEMQGETAVVGLAEQAMMLREALAGLLGIINDSDQRKHPSTMRMMNIVSGKSEFVAVDAARAALAATAPTPTEDAK